MKKNIYLIFTGLALIFIASCTKNFEEINTNPNNNPDKAPLTNVFAYIIQNLSAKYGTTEMEYAGSYVGYVTKGTYTDVTRYVTSPSPSIWNGVYSTTVRNSNFVIDEAEKEGNKNLQAATMILKAYGLQLVTDIYGKVPYTEAGQALSGVIHPKYDSEEQIYNDLLSQLDIANEILEDKAEAGLLGDGDLLYGGDILKWKKFCNSLHLRMAIRISNVNHDKAKAEISKILSDP
ncbi:MAG TPA: SusD/RagB family nutrient-binding outer membrane lipoprotein, partial [Bacteroidetes bacterium]|nr:SusD/RagB family nutrient-binding outer membrane lipoprotein [Bacteroidota bacterium]